MSTIMVWTSAATGGDVDVSTLDGSTPEIAACCGPGRPISEIVASGSASTIEVIRERLNAWLRDSESGQHPLDDRDARLAWERRVRLALVSIAIVSVRRWQITSVLGVDMGIYEGETEQDALDAMARDAGYESQEDSIARGIAPFAGRVVKVGS